MRNNIFFSAVAVALVASMAHAGAASRGTGGDAKAGLSYAEQICSECHAVRKNEKQSPHAQAPSFTGIANAKGMNPARLRVWFQSSHRSMPDLNLTERQSDDLVAYIVSLKRRK